MFREPLQIDPQDTRDGSLFHLEALRPAAFDFSSIEWRKDGTRKDYGPLTRRRSGDENRIPGVRQGIPYGYTVEVL